jgi:hypothetical protein
MVFQFYYGASGAGAATKSFDWGPSWTGTSVFRTGGFWYRGFSSILQAAGRERRRWPAEAARPPVDVSIPGVEREED